MAMDICQAESSPLVFVGQSFMIDSHQMHQRSLKIMDVNWIGGDVVAKVISRAVAVPSFYPSTSHVERKAPWVMIPTVIGLS